MTALKLSARLGETTNIPIRIETTTAFAAIASISNAAPVRIVTQAAHSLLDGWRATVVDAKGLTDLNDMPPARVAVIDTTTIEFPDLSSLSYRAHIAGTGALKFLAAKDLSDYTSARMDIKARVGGEILLTLTTADGTLEIDAANSAVWIRLTPTTLAEIPAGKTYVFDIELIDGTDVLAVCSFESTLTVLHEVTTSE